MVNTIVTMTSIAIITTMGEKLFFKLNKRNIAELIRITGLSLIAITGLAFILKIASEVKPSLF